MLSTLLPFIVILLFIILLPILRGCDGTPNSRPAALMERISSTAKCTSPPSYFGTDIAELRLDFNVLGEIRLGDTVSSSLLEEEVSMVLRQREDQAIYSTFSFDILGELGGTCILTYRGGSPISSSGTCIANVQHGSDAYEIRPCVKGSYMIGKIDPKLEDLDLSGDNNSPPSTSPQSSGSCPKERGNQAIEMMFLYSEGAEKVEGGSSLIEAKLIQEVAQANFALDNSGIKTRIHVTYLGPVACGEEVLEDEELSLEEKVETIRSYPCVEEYRARYGVDWVGIIVRNAKGETAGFASEDGEYMILKAGFSSRSLLVAHEIGHLLGASHTGCKTKDGRSTVMDPKGDRSPTFLPADPSCGNIDMRSLNVNALAASAIRCPLMVEEVVIVDHSEDDGKVPSMGDGELWTMDSYALYVRLIPDRNLVDLYNSQLPVPGQINYFYVMVRNWSNDHLRGTVTLWGFEKKLPQLDEDLVELAKSEPINLPPYSLTPVEIPFFLGENESPDLGFLARWREESEGQQPSLVLTGAMLLDLVAHDNQMAARASSTIILGAGAGGGPTLGENLWGRGKTMVSQVEESIEFEYIADTKIRIVPEASLENGKTFIEAGGHVDISFDGTFPPAPIGIGEHNGEDIPGEMGMEVNRDDREYTFAFSEKGHVQNENGRYTCYLRFTDIGTLAQGSYPIHVQQVAGSKVLGSYTYHVEAK